MKDNDTKLLEEAYDDMIAKNENDENSLAEKMNKAYKLSLNLAYKDINPYGHYFNTREDEFSNSEADMIFGWADGLMHKYYEKHTSGRTSIANMLNFNIEEFEKTVDHDIKIMERLLAKLGMPKHLTPDEYKAMGYKFTIS